MGSGCAEEGAGMGHQEERDGIIVRCIWIEERLGGGSNDDGEELMFGKRN